MTRLDPNLPKKVDRITIDKLDNGYSVQADTRFAGRVGHYCSNLKGVTKAVWLFFEGKIRLTKNQAEGVKGVLKTQQEKIEGTTDRTKEKEDA